MVGEGTAEQRTIRRIKALVLASVLIPCVLLGYLAVHVLRIREALMAEMARSRTAATARMAVSAAERALQGRIDAFLMNAMKLDLSTPRSRETALADFLERHLMTSAAFLFGANGDVVARAISPRPGTSEHLSRDASLPGRIYQALRSRPGERIAYLRSPGMEAVVLVAYTSLQPQPNSEARFLALVLDAGWLRRNIVEPILAEQEESSGLRLKLGERTATSREGNATAAFSDPFPLGVVEVSGIEAHLRHARNRDRVLLGAGLALVYGVVGGGLFLGWRVVKREWELARLKSTFVANVSHELRTPLALIRMYAESLMLGRVADEGKRTEYYKVLVREAGRLMHLINNVLDFSDMERDRKRFDFRRANLAEVVRRVLADYAPHLEQAGARLRADIREPVPDGWLDEGAVTQAFINLIDNAVKYSPDPPEILVRVYADGDLFLEVEDRGPGIPPENRTRVFEPFYRANPGVAPAGSGLGLALVRHVVESHRGTVHVESPPEGGSRFVIRLPCNDGGVAP